MSQMNQKELQSYFTSLCKSFYIAYKQVKRLEKETENLEKTNPHNELEVVKKLIETPEQDGIWKKYVTKKHSKEELQEREEELQLVLVEYNKKSVQIASDYQHWSSIYNSTSNTIENFLRTLDMCDITVKVTSKEEVIALMDFYDKCSVSRFRVINTQEEALKLFPANKKKYQEFFEAYCLEDVEKMKEVCNKYY